jgi:predicted dehydrogenase
VTTESIEIAGDASDVLPWNIPVRTGVVGLGYWGPNLARNLYELQDAELVAVCDGRRDALTAIRRRLPGVRRTTSFDDLLDDASIEAIAIATPVSTHYELASRALEAGKHVFVEKPLAASVAEAEALVTLAEQRKLVLMPGHTFLYSPAVNLIRSLIQNGDLGEIYFISMSRVNLGLHQSDVSVVSDLGPHDFSILSYWLDATPITASATARACVMPGTADVAFVDLEFANETIAHVELSWLAPSKLRHTTIVGSQKMVVYDDVSGEPVRVFDSGATLRNPETFGEYTLTYRTGDIVSPRVDVVEPLALEMADFCASIRAHRAPRSSAQLGLDVVRVIEAVESSLTRDGARVAVGNPAAYVA